MNNQRFMGGTLRMILAFSLKWNNFFLDYSCIKREEGTRSLQILSEI